MFRPKLFQITEEDVRGSIEQADIGKWCFIMNGCVMGFYDSPDQCDLVLDNQPQSELEFD